MAKYEEVVDLALRRSLFYPACEIYQDAPAGFYDYGPYGAAIRRKVVQLWRRHLIEQEGMLEIDGAITLPSSVFKSSGHLENFNDPMTRCKKCQVLHRADNILTEATGKEYKEAQSDEELTKALRENKLACPKCKGELTDVKRYNMMVRAEVGVAKTDMYMRPESCQSIFLDWIRMVKTMRVKLPKGIAQYGKAYRNEISPRQTLMRQVEFCQMEAEVFFDPDEINNMEGFEGVQEYKVMIQRTGEETATPISCKELVEKKIVSGQLIAYYLARTQQLFEKYGIRVEDMRFRELDDEERAFYAKEGWDFEVRTSLGWLELIANNYRTDYDIKNHMEGSKEDLRYVKDDGTKFIPHIWEISIGTDRTFYTVLENSLKKDEKRTVLQLPPKLAPIEVSVFPLLSNKPELKKAATELYVKLSENFTAFYDSSGSIGKRYARVDEVGCPVCITIDFESLENHTVTIRDRDTAEQKRVSQDKISGIIQQILNGTRFEDVQ